MENVIQENVTLRGIVTKQNNNIVELQADNDSLKKSVHQLRIDKAKIERDLLLKESKLPEPCVKRLQAAFATSADNAGLRSAIKIERNWGRADD